MWHETSTPQLEANTPLLPFSIPKHDCYTTSVIGTGGCCLLIINVCIFILFEYVKPVHLSRNSCMNVIKSYLSAHKQYTYTHIVHEKSTRQSKTVLRATKVGVSSEKC